MNDDGDSAVRDLAGVIRQSGEGEQLSFAGGGHPEGRPPRTGQPERARRPASTTLSGIKIKYKSGPLDGRGASCCGSGEVGVNITVTTAAGPSDYSLRRVVVLRGPGCMRS